MKILKIILKDVFKAILNISLIFAVISLLVMAIGWYHELPYEVSHGGIIEGIKYFFISIMVILACLFLLVGLSVWIDDIKRRL